MKKKWKKNHQHPCPIPFLFLIGFLEFPFIFKNPFDLGPFFRVHLFLHRSPSPVADYPFFFKRII